MSIKSKVVPIDRSIEADALASSIDEYPPSREELTRYYFNLTDGETMIRDEEGIETASLQAAVVSALEAVEELRAQDPCHSDEWQGWRLEIVDASGGAVQMIPLDVCSAH